jgi:phage terminase large subunit
MIPPFQPSPASPKVGGGPAIVHQSAKCCWSNHPLVHVAGCWWCPNPPCAQRQLKYATFTQDADGRVLRYLYVPAPAQAVWHEAAYNPAYRRILAGGAAGPGKSRFLREQLYLLARQVPGLHALLLRRTYPDLEQSHLRFMGHELAERGAQWNKTDRLATFLHPGGPPALIRCGFLDAKSDIENYLSSEYDVIVPDELVTFERDSMLELFTRCRTTNEKMIALRGDPAVDYDGSFVLSASNPGGRGGAWVKDFFIDKSPDPEEFSHYDPAQWAFFPAYLRDNPYIKAGGYEQSLSGLRENRKRQLLDGDWGVFEGQFFDEFRPSHHVVDLGAVSNDCPRFLSMDWGRNAPGVVLWWVALPDGHYYIEDEYKFNGDVSGKVTVQDVAREIKRRCTERGLKVPTCWTDPACWQHTGQIGESIADTFLKYRIPVAKANNDRRSGWQRLHEMFRRAPDGQPWLLVSPRCTYGIRTLPAQLQSKKDPDDLDTSGDDHWADALRYGGVSGVRWKHKPQAPVIQPYSPAWFRNQSRAPSSLLGSESR